MRGLSSAFRDVPEDNWTPAMGRERELKRRKTLTPPKPLGFVVTPPKQSVKNALKIRIDSEGVGRRWLEMIDRESPGPRRPVSVNSTIDVLMWATCITTGVSKTDFKSKRRFAGISYARQIFFFLARKHTDCSLPEIGRYTGGKDHSTVLHGVRKIAKLIEGKDRPTVNTIKAVEALL